MVSTEPLITQQGVTLRVSGKVAGSCGEFSLYRLALSQPDYATEVFRMLWRELGGTFKGQVRTGMVPGDAVVLASHDSPTLAEVIRQINKRSNNVMARTLLLTLGAERGRKPATVASSEAVARACWRARAWTCRNWSSTTAPACRARHACPPTAWRPC